MLDRTKYMRENAPVLRWRCCDGLTAEHHIKLAGNPVFRETISRSIPKSQFYNVGIDMATSLRSILLQITMSIAGNNIRNSWSNYSENPSLEDQQYPKPAMRIYPSHHHDIDQHKESSNLYRTALRNN